jgi:hypothetical protein
MGISEQISSFDPVAPVNWSRCKNGGRNHPACCCSGRPDSDSVSSDGATMYGSAPTSNVVTCRGLIEKHEYRVHRGRQIMEPQLIPPPNLAPPSVKHLALAKRIELWANLLDGCEAFLLAGLRSRIGPDGDLQAAFRDWYSRQMEEHERVQIQFLENLSQREAAYGG